MAHASMSLGHMTGTLIVESYGPVFILEYGDRDVCQIGAMK